MLRNLYAEFKTLANHQLMNINCYCYNINFCTRLYLTGTIRYHRYNNRKRQPLFSESVTQKSHILKQDYSHVSGYM